MMKQKHSYGPARAICVHPMLDPPSSCDSPRYRTGSAHRQIVGILRRWTAGAGGCLSDLHLAVARYEAIQTAHGCSAAVIIDGLRQLAKHVADVFMAGAGNAATPLLLPDRPLPQPTPCNAGTAAELLELVPTIAQAAIAAAGPVGGRIGADTLVSLARGRSSSPGTSVLLPILAASAQLPDGALSDQHSHDLSSAILNAIIGPSSSDCTELCKVLVALVARHPSCYVWPLALRSVLGKVPLPSAVVALRNVDVALQHAPVTAATIMGTFNVHDDVDLQLSASDCLLVLMLAQACAYKSKAFAVLTSFFDCPATGAAAERSAVYADNSLESIQASTPGDRQDILAAVVDASMEADVRVVRALVGLGLHWCDSSDHLRRSLQQLGYYVMIRVFRDHVAIRRELLDTFFSAVVEEPAASVKVQYCDVLEAVLIEHRSALKVHTTMLQSWVASIHSLAYNLQKRILDAVLFVASMHSSMSEQICMTLRKLMMGKCSTSRMLALHGLCSLLRAAITEQADDKIAEIVASLKAAFDLDYMVRKHLYGQLAILFRDLRSLDLVRHGESAQLSYLQQRVLSRFVAFANKQVHAEGAVCISGSSTGGRSNSPFEAAADIQMRWHQCFDCINEQAYCREPLAELTECVMCLIVDDCTHVPCLTTPDAAHLKPPSTSPGILHLVHIIIAMVRHCSRTDVLSNWQNASAISVEQKLDLLLALQEVLLRRFPPRSRAQEPKQSASSGSNPHFAAISNSDRFWLAETHAAMSTFREVVASKASQTTDALMDIGSICRLMQPYLQYLRSDCCNFPSFFGLVAMGRDEQLHHTATAPRTLPTKPGGPALRKRGRQHKQPWWVASPAPSKATSKPCESVSDQDPQTKRGQKVFPCPLQNFTDKLHCRISKMHASHAWDSVLSGRAKIRKLSAMQQSSAILHTRLDGGKRIHWWGDIGNDDAPWVNTFEQLIQLYDLSESIRWSSDDTTNTDAEMSGVIESCEGAESTHVPTRQRPWSSTSGQFDDSCLDNRLPKGCQRQLYCHAVEQMALRGLRPLTSSTKYSRVKLQMQPESCFYRCRAACIESMTMLLQMSEHQQLPKSGRLMLSESLLSLYSSCDVDLARTATPERSASICAVCFSSRLRAEVAVGVTPRLLFAYLHWIECLLSVSGDIFASNSSTCASVTENIAAILGSFELDMPTIIKKLLQLLFKLENSDAGISLALELVRSCSFTGLRQPSRRTCRYMLHGQELLLSATQKCRYTAMQVAISFLVCQIKQSRCTFSIVARVVECLAAAVTESSVVPGLSMPIAVLAEHAIGRGADLCRQLCQCWPSPRQVDVTGELRVDE